MHRVRRSSCRAIALASCCFAFAISPSIGSRFALAAEPTYVIESSDTVRVVATLRYEVHCPNMAATHWTVFAAAAPRLPSQRDVKSTSDPAADRILDGRTRRRDVLAIGVPANAADQKQRVRVEVRYEATLVRRRLRERTKHDRFGAPAALGRDEQTVNLAATKEANHDDAAFAAMLDKHELRRRADESEIAFARRAFTLGKSRGTYVYRADIPRRATEVAESWRTDCGGWSNWFVAVMRASGIPARALVGRWARSASDDNADDGPANRGHVKAEFFARGIGWVPVDLSQAVQHERRTDGLRHFGVDDGDFIVLHVDTDFELQTKQMPRRNWMALQSPVFWVTGKGKVDGATTTDDWQVRQLAAGRE